MDVFKEVEDFLEGHVGVSSKVDADFAETESGVSFEIGG